MVCYPVVVHLQIEYLPGKLMPVHTDKDEFVSSGFLLGMRFPTDMHIMLKTPPAQFYLIDIMNITNSAAKSQ
jgi:hypothetical protein